MASVDRTLFSPTRRDVAWRREQGFGDDEIVLLFFGRLVVEKGTEIFAAVVDALRARGHKVRALLVGEGPMREKLTASLGDAVFTGHLEDAALARAVASADILINPSATEAFGNVNLEAMAAGLAIVSADVPSASALIENGRSGMLVPADDIEAYTDAVAQLMQNDERRLRLGADACTASARFDWPTALDAVIETYALTGAAGYDAAAIEHGAQMTKGVSRAA